jgi:hypothetical protein
LGDSDPTDNHAGLEQVLRHLRALSGAGLADNDDNLKQV